MFIIFYLTLFIIYLNINLNKGWERVNPTYRSLGSTARHTPYRAGISCGIYDNGKPAYCPRGSFCGYLNDDKGWKCSPSEGDVFCEDTNDFCPKGFYCTVSNSSLCTPNTNRKKGVYVFDELTIDEFKCLKEKKEIQFVIIDYFGIFGYEIINNNKNAREAGIDDIDIYIRPCVKSKGKSYSPFTTCGNPRKIITDVLNGLKNNNVNFGRVWLEIRGDVGEDIDHYTGYGQKYDWYLTIEENIKFIDEMIKILNEKKQPYGIYSDKYLWQRITGNTQIYNNIPLWYSNINNKENNFNDYYDGYSFGGWKNPTIKETNASIVCRKYVDNIWKQEE
ncbi:hypothetical protein Mgra_00008389 [Meloidogyne graminicola]|uniref:Lysozyme n=1 Tax=Meloidogyne graminicola TaxID=189291 RepID=A0A8S9ZG00_9BILA|nr:hypothetical protein Mgra_00008389 [Meloidogyne graminicola]